MELKYVGAKPKVSGKGVSFDQTKPDKYTFLTAAVELLEAFESEVPKDNIVNLHNVRTKEYSSHDLLELLKKHCTNLQSVFDSREEKTNTLIETYLGTIDKNEHISADERRAWIGNVNIMRDYYLQYITNESAYECALHALADKIHAQHIDAIHFPMGRNHGLVLSHLVDVLRDHIPPYDATMIAQTQEGETHAILSMNRPRPIEL
jgi:hypothetical protein